MFIEKDFSASCSVFIHYKGKTLILPPFNFLLSSVILLILSESSTIRVNSLLKNIDSIGTKLFKGISRQSINNSAKLLGFYSLNVFNKIYS